MASVFTAPGTPVASDTDVPGEETVGRLIDSYRQPAFNLAYRLVRRPEDAADAVQDAFVLAVRATRGTTAAPREPGRFGSWLLKIVANVALAQLRRRHSGASVSLDALSYELPDAHADQPLTMIVQREQRGDVLQALLALPDAQRAALTLREYQGLTYDEIGELLGLNRGATTALLYRARAAFRAAYEGVTAEPQPVGCPDLATLISAMIDDELETETWRRVDRHVAGCRRCRRELRGLRRGQRLHTIIPILAPPAGWSTASALGAAGASSAAGAAGIVGLATKMPGVSSVISRAAEHGWPLAAGALIGVAARLPAGSTGGGFTSVAERGIGKLTGLATAAGLALVVATGSPSHHRDVDQLSASAPASADVLASTAPGGSAQQWAPAASEQPATDLAQLPAPEAAPAESDHAALGSAPAARLAPIGSAVLADITVAISGGEAGAAGGQSGLGSPSSQASLLDPPGVDLPAVDLPSLDLSPLDLPPIDLPAAGLPSVDLPAVDLPPIDLPMIAAGEVNRPPIDLPAIDVPPVDLPAVELPVANLPPLDLPVIDLPAIDVPPLDLPPGELPLAELPMVDGTLDRVRGVAGQTLAEIDQGAKPLDNLGDVMSQIPQVLPSNGAGGSEVSRGRTGSGSGSSGSLVETHVDVSVTTGSTVVDGGRPTDPAIGANGSVGTVGNGQAGNGQVGSGPVDVSATVNADASNSPRSNNGSVSVHAGIDTNSSGPSGNGANSLVDSSVSIDTGSNNLSSNDGNVSVSVNAGSNSLSSSDGSTSVSVDTGSNSVSNNDGSGNTSVSVSASVDTGSSSSGNTDSNSSSNSTSASVGASVDTGSNSSSSNDSNSVSASVSVSVDTGSNSSSHNDSNNSGVSVSVGGISVSLP